MPYAISYSNEAREHLRSLTARQRSIVVDAIDDNLGHQPTLQTRNRKPTTDNPLGSWVLRVGDLRVYYEAQSEPAAVVVIQAIGVKERNFLRAGDRTYDLTGPSTDEDDQR